MILKTYSDVRRPIVGDKVYDAITGVIGTVGRDLGYPYQYPVEILFSKGVSRTRAMPAIAYRELHQVLLIVED